MSKIFFLLGLTLLLHLISCSASYKQASEYGRGKLGYSEKQVERGRYVLHYGEETETPVDTVHAFWLRRATELCGSDRYYYKKMYSKYGYVVMKSYNGFSWPTMKYRGTVDGVVDCVNVDRETPSLAYFEEKGEENLSEFEKWEYVGIVGIKEKKKEKEKKEGEG